MKLSKLLVVAFFIAFLAFTIQCVDSHLSKNCQPAGNSGFSWIAFQAWAMYFLAGCTLLGAVRTFLGYASGIVASVAIMELGGAFTGIVGTESFLTPYMVPAAIFVIVVPVILMEKLSLLMLDFVPAVFVGAGVFFGFMSYVLPAVMPAEELKVLGFQGYINAGTTILIYCALGLFYGWMTVAFRKKVEKSA